MGPYTAPTTPPCTDERTYIPRTVPQGSPAQPGSQQPAAVDDSPDLISNPRTTQGAGLSPKHSPGQSRSDRSAQRRFQDGADSTETAHKATEEGCSPTTLDTRCLRPSLPRGGVSQRSPRSPPARKFSRCRRQHRRV